MKSSADGLFPADNVLISNSHSVHSTHGCRNASMCIKIRPSFAFVWTRRLSARRKHKSRPCVTQKRDLKPQLENSSSVQRAMGDAPCRHSIDLTEKHLIFQVFLQHVLENSDFPLACKFTTAGVFEQVCTKWWMEPEARQRSREHRSGESRQQPWPEISPDPGSSV